MVTCHEKVSLFYTQILLIIGTVQAAAFFSLFFFFCDDHELVVVILNGFVTLISISKYIIFNRI